MSVKSLVHSLMLALAVSAHSHSTRHSFGAHSTGEIARRALPDGWSSLGCYTDGEARTLTGYFYEDYDKMTATKCAAACVSRGFSFAGTEYYGQCYCGNAIASTGTRVDKSECNTPCAGNKDKMCGGGYRLSLYGVKSSTPSLPSGWSVDQTCVEDSDQRILTGFNTALSPNSPSACIAQCSSRGFSIAGLQAGNECWCGNSYTRSLTTKPASECATPCVGTTSQTCGGGWRMSTYKSNTSTPPTLPMPAGGSIISKCVKPNTVALTFDDGPYQWLRELSDEFTKYNAKATFFFNGNNWGCIYSQANIDNIRYAYAAGHEMASHSWDHVDLATYSSADFLHDQLWKMEQALQRIVGVVPAYMRPPYGSSSSLLQDVARIRGQALAIWDFDSLDWQNESDTIKSDYDNYFSSRPSNALVLNHEVHDHTPHVVIPYVLKKLTDMGYQLVTLSECMGTQAYQSVNAPGTPDGSWTC